MSGHTEIISLAVTLVGTLIVLVWRSAVLVTHLKTLQRRVGVAQRKHDELEERVVELEHEKRFRVALEEREQLQRVRIARASRPDAREIEERLQEDEKETETDDESGEREGGRS